jgi:hypothetical protein
LRRSAAARPKGSEANCQSEGEHRSHGCDYPLAGPCYPILSLQKRLTFSPSA